jgi:hypothetical protein
VFKAAQVVQAVAENGFRRWTVRHYELAHVRWESRPRSDKASLIRDLCPLRSMILKALPVESSPAANPRAVCRRPLHRKTSPQRAAARSEARQGREESLGLPARRPPRKARQGPPLERPRSRRRSCHALFLSHASENPIGPGDLARTLGPRESSGKARTVPLCQPAQENAEGRCRHPRKYGSSPLG